MGKQIPFSAIKKVTAEGKAGLVAAAISCVNAPQRGRLYHSAAPLKNANGKTKMSC